MKIHLIGIGGTGMGALAGLLREAGHDVRGSDGPLYPPMSTLLEELGIPRFEGYRPENLDWGPQRVVVGNICRVDHPEAAAARERGLSLTSFPALLGELFLAERHAIVVAGTHGKTTTSTMAAHLLRTAGLDPGYLIGGLPRVLPHSFAIGRCPYFVVEGDEYDCAHFDKRPKFVHYRPRSVILTGVEFDHADIYPTMQAVEAAFASLVALVPPDGRILVCADSEPALRLCRRARCPVEAYSASGQRARWQARTTPRPGGRQLLEVSCDGQPLLGTEIGLTGAHNASNALAVVALASGLGVAPPEIVRGLGSFAGVRRRQEVRGVGAGVTVIDDFAHHPTAIRTTLDGLRGVHGPGRLIAVFEPRSATSRRGVFQHSFVEAFAPADLVLLAPLHAPEGIPLDQRLDVPRLARDIAASGIEAMALETVAQMVDRIVAWSRVGDTVVVMSSGSFGGLVDRLLQALRQREPQDVV